MNILADTHILIWVLLDHERLPLKARALLSDPNNDVYFSSVSVWEIAMKHAAHPHELPFTGEAFYELCLKSGFQLADISISHIFAFEALRRAEGAPAHKDPFDKLMIAQSKTEGMTFLTHDSLLSDYKEPCVLQI